MQYLKVSSAATIHQHKNKSRFAQIIVNISDGQRQYELMLQIIFLRSLVAGRRPIARQPSDVAVRVWRLTISYSPPSMEEFCQSPHDLVNLHI